MRTEKGYRLRMLKLGSKICPANTTTNIDLVVPQAQYANSLYVLTDVPSFMTGAQYEVKNSNLDDEIKFQVVHSNYGVVDEFASISAIDGSHSFEEYLADLPSGLTIRLVYINTGDNVAEVKCNIKRHINTSGVDK